MTTVYYHTADNNYENFADPPKLYKLEYDYGKKAEWTKDFVDNSSVNLLVTFFEIPGVTLKNVFLKANYEIEPLLENFSHSWEKAVPSDGKVTFMKDQNLIWNICETGIKYNHPYQIRCFVSGSYITKPEKKRITGKVRAAVEFQLEVDPKKLKESKSWDWGCPVLD